MAAFNSSKHQRLRTARIAKGYSNAKTFAHLHQIPYATYIAHESGKINLSEKAAQNYANILKIPLAWLLDGSAEGSFPGTATNAIHFKRKQFERIILPKVVESILIVLNKKDDTLDIEALMHKAHIITSEILARAETEDDVETHINSIVVLSESNLRKAVIIDNK